MSLKIVDTFELKNKDLTREGSISISQAIQQAQISENDVVYINAHGTGTHMNDVAETKAIKLALGEERAHKAHITTNKSMIGHLLAQLILVKQAA